MVMSAATGKTFIYERDLFACLFPFLLRPGASSASERTGACLYKSDIFVKGVYISMYTYIYRMADGERDNKQTELTINKRGKQKRIFRWNGAEWNRREISSSIAIGCRRDGRLLLLLLLLLLVGESLVDGCAPAVSMLDGGDCGCAGRSRQAGYGRLAALAFQKPDEDALERPVEYRVNERVDGGRDVAQPQASGHQPVGDVRSARRPHHHQ